jgi:acetyl esterase/lipase
MSSVITAQMAARQGKLWAELRVSEQHLAWLEFDPADGRNRLCIRPARSGLFAGSVRRLTPSPWSVRSRVHEYGGGSYCWVGQWLVFVNDADQGLYWQATDEEGLTPRKLWYQPGHRYGDLQYDPIHQRLLMVEEIHPGKQVQNRLVALPLQRVGMEVQSPPRVLAEGDDFYSSPRISPCGLYLSWLSWNHPLQPWLATCLQLAELNSAGMPVDVLQLVSLDEQIAVFQPEFDESSQLYFVADRKPQAMPGAAAGVEGKDDWWNLYRYQFSSGQYDPALKPNRLRSGHLQALLPQAKEFGVAQWQLGLSTYCLLPGGRLLASWFDQGKAGVLELNLATGLWHMRHQGLSRCHSLQSLQSRDAVTVHTSAVLLTEQADQPTCLRWLDSNGSSRVLEQLGERDPLVMPVTTAVTQPQVFCCETADGQSLWGFYYPPQAASSVGNDLAPPMLIQVHGGPTSMADSSFDPLKHFWTSRGFGLLVLNYRGSSGFGRDYRLQLHQQWGVSDVEDVFYAARYAVQQGWADAQRLFARGNSAGGYTVLRVLSADHSVSNPVAGVRIRAGASHYGISDLALLNRHTHKFESHYLHWLIGDEAEQAERYRQRSPIFYPHADWKPVIFFQGEQDRVVPASQTRNLHDVLQQRGKVSEYCLFDGEGHGFRQARHRQVVLERELAFYRTFALQP